MAYTTIDDPSEYFTVKTYTGTGSTQSITNNANAGNFKPDWLWIKQRNTSRAHRLITSAFFSNYIQSNTADAEASNDVVNSLDTNGFTLSTPASVNQSSGTYVAWQWKCNGGTATATISESGNNPAATVQANTTAGFSIITYTGTGASGTIAHGLGARPKWISIKNRDAGEQWFINGELITGNTNGSFHYNTDDEYTGGSNNMTASSIDTNNIHVITSGNVNTDGQKYVAYCFAEIKGYSKFGTYKGNGNADGAFIYTGFKPAWLMTKNINGTDANWHIYDSKRNTHNVIGEQLYANLSDAGADATDLDFLSNGFKWRRDVTGGNASGTDFIYIAFAEHPFVSSKGVPVTAR